MKDCKVLGLGNESNVRFCRSMEVFVGEKSLLRGGRMKEEQ